LAAEDTHLLGGELAARPENLVLLDHAPTKYSSILDHRTITLDLEKSTINLLPRFVFHSVNDRIAINSYE
jgi:hypothetical protein